MRKFINSILVLLCCLIAVSSQAQTTDKDSLWSVWEDASHSDSIRLMSLNTVILKYYLFAQPDTAFHLAQLQYDYAIEYKVPRWKAAARSTQGVAFHIQGNYYKAIKYYNEALTLAEKLKDKKLIANTVNNIGIIYREQGEYDKAIDHFKRSFKIKKEIGDKLGASNSLGNIGGVYSSKKENDIALDYYNRGLAIQQEVGNKRTTAGFLNNIGSILMQKEDYDKALEYFEESLKIREEIGDLRSQASSLTSLGALNFAKKNYNEAIIYNKRALKISQEVGLVAETKQASRYLYDCYKAMGKSKEALEMLELFIIHKDSIGNEKNKNEIIRQEFKYQYEKQHLADSLQFNQKQMMRELEHQTRLRHEKNQRYILYGGILLLLILAGVVFRSYSQKKKNNIPLSEKNDIITKQRDLVEEKNKEITDSITYAKRIQNAILPSKKVVKEFLQDSFILYKPKDIVAGDFYWMESVGEKVLFAAADCTGHGVPGAMVSVVCNNGLNRSVREHGLTDPGEILDKTRAIVVAEFEKSEEEVQDGMDIALCSLEGNKLHYAGAHNPLWIIRNGELIETKANKQPIGKFENPEPYTTHIIELEKGDTFYIFSDGYADQFGGEKGKKMKSENFKKLLLSVQKESMDAQLEIINKTFEDWRGDLEQLDDVCLIGVRV
jgi:serine phosphatase RsbU (regulator of sigma subunit)/Tfp pilus assembly protein PilF